MACFGLVFAAGAAAVQHWLQESRKLLWVFEALGQHDLGFSVPHL